MTGVRSQKEPWNLFQAFFVIKGDRNMETSRKIIYTTPDEQINLLQAKGLIFENTEFAVTQLHEYGYYNIINSYKTPYITMNNGKKCYIPNTTFEQIYSLFTLDHNLRNSIMAAMLDFEEHLRAAAAEVVARNFGTDHNDYLKWENYRDRRVSKDRFSLRGILGTLQQNLMSDKDPIRYYRETYRTVPPWILFKGTYFSTLINLVRLFKNAQKQELIRLMYNIDESISSLPIVSRLFSETLFVCLDFRNRAAHGGRIYNFEPRNTAGLLNNSELLHIFPDLETWKTCHGVCQLLGLLSCFSYMNPHYTIDSSLSDEINRHLADYPQDKSFLESILGLEILFKKVVWISPKSKKYHSDPTCSGIKSYIKITFDEEAFSLNHLIPCKRCCRDKYKNI